MYIIFSTKDGKHVIKTTMSEVPAVGDTVMSSKGKKEWLVRDRAFVVSTFNRFWQSERAHLTVTEVV